MLELVYAQSQIKLVLETTRIALSVNWQECIWAGSRQGVDGMQKRLCASFWSGLKKSEPFWNLNLKRKIKQNSIFWINLDILENCAPNTNFTY